MPENNFMMELIGSVEKPEIASCWAAGLVVDSAPVFLLNSPELLGLVAARMRGMLDVRLIC